MSGRSHEFFVQQADAASASVNKLTLLCLVPIFAVATKLVITGRPYRFVQCLIFGVHFYCIHMATILAGWGLVLIPIVRWFIAHPDATWGHPLVVLWKSNWFAHFSVAPVLLPYLYVALQRAFDLDKRAAGWRALVLTLASCTLLRAFFDVGAVIMMIAA